jgi:hypothetical protein
MFTGASESASYLGIEEYGMRALLLLTAILATGCASQPANQSAGQTTEAGRLALAKNLNLKLVDKDGQQLYCRNDFITGSHIQRDMTCFTAEQLDMWQTRTQRDWDQLTYRGALGAGGIRGP